MPELSRSARKRSAIKAAGGRQINVKTAGPGQRGGVVQTAPQNVARQTAAKALATGTSASEAAQTDVEDSLESAEEFGDLADEVLGAKDPFTDKQVARLLDRAQGVGISVGEQALNRAISAGTAQQKSLASGASARGNLITAGRQGGRAAAAGTRNINRTREITRLQDQFSAQDQLAQALAQKRGGQGNVANLLAKRGLDLGQLQGQSLSGLLGTQIGQQLGLQDLEVGDVTGDLLRRLKEEQARVGTPGSSGALGGVLSAGGALLGSTLGGFGGGGEPTLNSQLDNLGFTGGTSTDDILNLPGGGFQSDSDPLSDFVGFGGEF